MKFDPVNIAAIRDARIHDPHGGPRRDERAAALGARVANSLKQVLYPISDMLHPNPQQRLNSKLRHACRNGDVSKVRSLIHKGADVNAQSAEKGYTAVHEAARSPNPDVMRNVLAVRDVNVNQPAKITPGLTPLHIAALTANANATAQLLNAGANPLATTMATAGGATPYEKARILANTAGVPQQHIRAAEQDPSTVLGQLYQAEVQARAVVASLTTPGTETPSYAQDLASSANYRRAFG